MDSQLRRLVGSATEPVLPDHAIVASSQWNDNFRARNIRTGSLDGWMEENGKPAWIQFNLGEPREIHRVEATCKRYGPIAEIALEFSADGKAWHPYTHALGFSLALAQTKGAKLDPFVATHLRLTKTPGGMRYPGSLQVEFWGCEPRQRDVGPNAKYCSRVNADIFAKMELADCQVVCSGASFPCHRVFLAAMSPVLRTALTGSFREAAESRIEIGDAEPAAAHALIKYAYTGSLPPDMAVAVFPLAHRYDIPELVQVCVNMMHEHIAKENVVEIMALLSQFCDHPMVEEVWPQIVQKVRADAKLADAALRNVRRKLA